MLDHQLTHVAAVDLVLLLLAGLRDQFSVSVPTDGSDFLELLPLDHLLLFKLIIA